MKSGQYAEFEALLERAALLTFQQRGKDWRALVTAMFEELAAYDLESVRAAIAEHVRSEKFFPALADIVRRIEGPDETRAALAWAVVIRAVTKLGRVASVRFPSPAYHYAIERMGGWQKLCATLRDADLPFRGREFERLFAAGEKVAAWEPEPGKVAVPTYLMGWHEAANRRDGYALPDVIDAATGEPIKGLLGSAALPEPDEKSVVIMKLAEGMGAG
jgi:hypothetical protein